jgi:hypothetical protein
MTHIMNILFVNLITVVVEKNIYHRLNVFIDDRIIQRKMCIFKKSVSKIHLVFKFGLLKSFHPLLCLNDHCSYQITLHKG